MPGEPVRQNWLTLGAASAQLGVSESTIRRWADVGEIRSYRTHGGHRRILEEDLLAIVANAGVAAAARDTDRISDLALARVKRRITRGRQGHSLDHFSTMSPEAIDRLRLLGRQVVDLFARYIASDSKKERFTEDARTIGREYGRSLVSEKVGLTAAVATFNSMRRSLEETASQIAIEAGLSTDEAVEAVESTLELADQILEGMASVYELASG
ncbi:MAG: helix-turn-helix domain-containing protein [Dehalococcoidia bacterium]|nr:helix-turn-helix domain-containing protein [Dehalococcoidia bacterium]